MNAPARPWISRRRIVFAIVLGLTLLLAWRAGRPARHPRHLLRVPGVQGYTLEATTFPSMGRSQLWAHITVSFTNPTSESLWYMQRPTLMLNPVTLREPEPARQSMYKRAWRDLWREKTSRLPHSLQSSWSLWTDPLPSRDYHIKNQSLREFVHELRPGESRNLGFYILTNHVTRVGLVCRATARNGKTNEWTTHWSDEILVPPPPSGAPNLE